MINEEKLGFNKIKLHLTDKEAYTRGYKDGYAEAMSKIVEAWDNNEYPEYLEDDIGKILKEAGYI